MSAASQPLARSGAAGSRAGGPRAIVSPVAPDSSALLPGFLRKLQDPAIKTVLLAGCGGGFDFVHGLMLWPELRRLGKKVVVGSYSFGDPAKIGNAPTVFEEGQALARYVTAQSVPARSYAPEVHAASFLDERFPEDGPHGLYAFYARAFTVPTLTRLYGQLVQEHQVDAVILVDGGSDSLMAGDEEGLGDPVEDAVSITTVADLPGPKLKLLLTTGLGADRFNHVSDAATLRAIAELTRAGGFLGALSLEPDGVPMRLYRDLLAHLDARHAFRSVLSASILASAEGGFGSEAIPETVAGRVSPGGLFLWPLMAMVFAFDVQAVAARSRFPGWLRTAQTVHECYARVLAGREALSLRPVENLPRHEDLRNPDGRFL